MRIGAYVCWAAMLLAGLCGGCAGSPPCDSAVCREDAATTAEVRSLLAAHPGITPPSLYVLTRAHVVYLYGIVDTEMERRTAGEVAREAKGGVQVVNLLGINNR